jgi:peptidyl-tRNA hydrolase, PTH1 family
VRLILGIGNPGSRYKLNRHNVGFLFLDHFAKKHSIQFKPSKGDYYRAEGDISGSEFLLIKPTTYVNNSGIPAKDILDEKSLTPSELLVIFDDVNLPFGRFRLKAFGSSGGHNGMSSIIYHLNSDQFPRIRIGIDRSKEESLSDYVLSDFNSTEFLELEKIFDLISVITGDFITGGIKTALDTNSRVNSKVNSENKQKDNLGDL